MITFEYQAITIVPLRLLPQYHRAIRRSIDSMRLRAIKRGLEMSRSGRASQFATGDSNSGDW